MTNPETALNEFSASGLQASDLGKWSYVVSQSLQVAVRTEAYDPGSLDGRVTIFSGEETSGEPIADAAHNLHRAKFSEDLRVGLASAVAELQSGSDPATVAERIVRGVAGLRDGRTANSNHRPLTNELPVLFDAVSAGGSMARPVPTGISKLDAVIYGWQPTLCLIGADPGVGKSAFITKSCYNGARNGIKSAVFMLEDPPKTMATRLVSSISRVEVLKILYGKLSEAELALVEAGLEELGRHSDNIIVVDGSERPMAVERLCSTAKSLIAGSGVQCIYVDHAGELRSTERDRHDLEVSSQLSSLRGLANATGVPVVVAMHMRRRLNSKPTLSDFANSSGAERKARLALALTREPGAEVIQAHILKQTNGPSGISVDIPFDLRSGTVS